MNSDGADSTKSQSTGSQPNTQNQAGLAPAVQSEPSYRRHNATTLRRSRPQTYKRIIDLLAQQVPVDNIRKQLRVSHNSIDAVRRLESETVDEKKRTLALLCANVAEHGFGLISDKINRMNHKNLIVASGVAADKLVALTQSGPEIAVAIQVNSQDSVKLSAALKQFMPPEIDS